RRVRNATAAIVDLQHQRLRVTLQPNVSRLASRVSMNVDQRLLNDPKERRLVVARQPPEPLGQIKIHVDAAALGKPGHVPPQRRQQTRLVEKWREGQGGESAGFGARLFCER